MNEAASYRVTRSQAPGEWSGPDEARRPPPPGSAQPYADYLRESRRLRAKLARNPLGLYRQLKELGEKTRSEGVREPMPETPWKPAPLPDPVGAAGFAAYVAQCLKGPILPYSDRLALLRDAGRRGLGRFEANLIIAAVQHRAEASSTKPPAAPGALRTVATLGVVLLVQFAILAGCWWIGSR